MNTIDPLCEETQCTLSFAFDEGRELPPSALAHAAQCADCTAFLNSMTATIPDRLSSSLPPAGIELRQRILALPQQQAAAQSSIKPKRYGISAAAAALVLGFCAYSWFDNQATTDPVTVVAPEPTAVPTPAPQVRDVIRSAHEIAAMKADLRRGMASLQSTSNALNQLLIP